MLFFSYFIVITCIVLGLCHFVCTLINSIRGRGIRTVYADELSENDTEYEIRSFLKKYPNADIVVKGSETADDIAKRLSFTYKRVNIKK